jgi:hypothetical protein
VKEEILAYFKSAAACAVNRVDASTSQLERGEHNRQLRIGNQYAVCNDTLIAKKYLPRGDQKIASGSDRRSYRKNRIKENLGRGRASNRMLETKDLAGVGVREQGMLDEDVPSSVELRWRPDDHQAAFTFSS